MTQARILSTTTDTEFSAEDLARTSLALKLAACVQIIPNVRSLYMWKDQISDDKECLLQFKTSAQHIQKLMAHIKAHL